MNTMGPLVQRNFAIAAMSLGVVITLPSTSLADNPIVQTHYTADPAPMVYDGRVYVYTSHDEDVTVNDFFTMNDWRVYSSTDMVNWTDHGSPLAYTDFGWSSGDAWAGQCIPRNGKFYWYVPLTYAGLNRPVIGVAVGDSPIGPFEDAIGQPLVYFDWGDIDPTVFIDDDGQAYLYWGNPDLHYVTLNEDMISYSGSVHTITFTPENFGPAAPDGRRPTQYEEGPWLYKRNDLYYMLFSSGGIPESIAYSTSAGPLGPWSYQGVIMPAQGGSFTNHSGVIDYQGRSYFFYHNGALPGGHGFHRSVCVEEFTYNADGSFPTIMMSGTGPAAVASLNPFAQTEAETIAWELGIETEPCSEGGMNVTDISKGDYIKVKEVEFGDGATSFDARVASASGGGEIALHLDSLSGTTVGTCAVDSTGGDQTWATQTCAISGAAGKHDLFLKFTSGGFKFNWWKFSGPGDPGTGGTGGTDGEGGAAGSTGAEPTAGEGGAAGTPSTEPTAGEGGAAGTADAESTAGEGGAAGSAVVMVSGGSAGTAGGVASSSSGAAAGTSGIGEVIASGGSTITGHGFQTTGVVSVGGGTNATAGSPPEAGSMNGGTGTAEGGQAGAGGNTQSPGGPAGAAGTTSSDVDAGPSGTASSDDGGCACHVASGRSNRGTLGAFGALGLLALCSLRRRPKVLRQTKPTRRST